MIFGLLSSSLANLINPVSADMTLSYPIVDTSQECFYDDENNIIESQIGEPFYGQDAQYQGNKTQHADNGD